MKFITDGMLGKLTRWLCMLGHNVKYFDRLTDNGIECMPVVDKENRTQVVGIIRFRDIENRYETALTKLQSQRELTMEEIEDDI